MDKVMQRSWTKKKIQTLQDQIVRGARDKVAKH